MSAQGGQAFGPCRRKENLRCVGQGRSRKAAAALWRARRLEALVNLVAWTGLRRSEALWCKVEDLDLDGGTVNVVSRSNHRTKSQGSENFVILPQPACVILREWLRHRLSSEPGVERVPDGVRIS